jgi:hypothetical protein
MAKAISYAKSIKAKPVNWIAILGRDNTTRAEWRAAKEKLQPGINCEVNNQNVNIPRDAQGFALNTTLRIMQISFCNAINKGSKSWSKTCYYAIKKRSKKIIKYHQK